MLLQSEVSIGQVIIGTSYSVTAHHEQLPCMKGVLLACPFFTTLLHYSRDTQHIPQCTLSQEYSEQQPLLC